ncbi:DUF4040 domain-containing protein [Natrialbaceae archaeon AArc-T1-2]|uniref:DUF4040 domain-containing protein n=1 Tax=Natrialbaceae archaeon AArc-T1-2 TaxID=3053904 RepID=UPI00255B31BA|nr:DUF4040 domain-containing protein [Natrialbaceae archaeon AArc-T1-2]WIV66200.1 DUF4040 domain-containing protein [Natrialbaceae archaeon AArc-T1-2]
MIWLELGLIAFVIIAAVFVALARDVVGAIVTFAAFGLGISVIWTLLAAPDVALVEAAVGAGVISVLLLITLVKTTGRSTSADDAGLREKLQPLNGPALLILGGLAIPLGYTILSLPAIGDPTAPAVSAEFADGTQTPYGYYIAETLDEAGFPNAVVSVLVVYRGLDTLGELIVAFSAAVSVLVVLKRDELL